MLKTVKNEVSGGLLLTKKYRHFLCRDCMTNGISGPPGMRRNPAESSFPAILSIYHGTGTK
jgi:hypothetical protein